jgi:hypothetical protein
MTSQSNPVENKAPRTRVVRQTGASEAVYGLGLIGAWVYYFTHAATFGLGVLGFFKGLVWPAMLVYAALKSLGM